MGGTLRIVSNNFTHLVEVLDVLLGLMQGQQDASQEVDMLWLQWDHKAINYTAQPNYRHT